MPHLLNQPTFIIILIVIVIVIITVVINTIIGTIIIIIIISSRRRRRIKCNVVTMTMVMIIQDRAAGSSIEAVA